MSQRLHVVSAVKFVWVGSSIINNSSVFEAVKSVFSKALKSVVAQWKRGCPAKGLWSGSTEISLGLFAQKDPRKSCGPVPTPQRQWQVLRSVGCSRLPQHSEGMPVISEGGSWEELSNIQETLSTSFFTSIK